MQPDLDPERNVIRLPISGQSPGDAGPDRPRAPESQAAPRESFAAVLQMPPLQPQSTMEAIEAARYWAGFRGRQARTDRDQAKVIMHLSQALSMASTPKLILDTVRCHESIFGTQDPTSGFRRECYAKAIELEPENSLHHLEYALLCDEAKEKIDHFITAIELGDVNAIQPFLE